MKKVIFIIFIAFLWIFPSSTSAAGTICCPPSYKYISPTECNYMDGLKKTEPNKCLDGEKCVTLEGGGPLEGICTVSETVNKCCKRGKYIGNNKCEYNAIIEPSLCSSGASCAEDYCVSGTNITAPIFNICNPLKGDEKQYNECTSCLDGGGILTALGCIKTNPKDFIADFLKIALGIAGGIALLLMVYGAFLISMSAGDPKKADEGKEIITGTIAGLLFIIFSVFLLKLIGVDILQIPGF